MKVRVGFVSNSSSSSFVIFGDPTKAIEEMNNIGYDDALVNGYLYEINNQEIKQNIVNDIIKRHETRMGKDMPINDDVDIDNKLFITTYISDGIWYGDLEGCQGVYYYEDGNHGCPYSPEEHIQLDSCIWIQKEHFIKERNENEI